MNLMKKISLDKFQEKSRQVVELVNSQKIEVIVYDKSGPVARLYPYKSLTSKSKLKTMESTVKNDVDPMDQGGVWNLGAAAEKDNNRPKWWLSPISLNGMWKAAKVSAILPFISKF